MQKEEPKDLKLAAGTTGDQHSASRWQTTKQHVREIVGPVLAACLHFAETVSRWLSGAIRSFDAGANQAFREQSVSQQPLVLVYIGLFGLANTAIIASFSGANSGIYMSACVSTVVVFCGLWWITTVGNEIRIQQKLRELSNERVAHVKILLRAGVPEDKIASIIQCSKQVTARHVASARESLRASDAKPTKELTDEESNQVS